MRAALHDGQLVDNVIVLDEDSDYQPPEGLTLITLPDDSPVGPGWRHVAGEFTPPPRETLEAPAEVEAGGDPVDVIYTNTHDDAPQAATFTVNGATATVDLTDGTAVLEVTIPQPGPVTITVADAGVPSVTIRGV